MSKLDVLNRQEFVESLAQLIDNMSANKVSTTFAINGSWGSGKTFVLDLLEKRLTPTQTEDTAIDKYFIIRYNCWKYDYYDEPLVAIVVAMIDIINQKTRLWNDERKKAHVLGILKAVGASFISMANGVIKDKVGVDIQALVDETKECVSSELTRVEQSHDYDSYFLFNQALRHLQDLIVELTQDQTVIFVVDELDRCLPEYAIKVLERLHHLTNGIENEITVISIDKTQLLASINKIFGFTDPAKYLQKFIHFEIALPYGRISEEFAVKHEEYLALFDKSIVQYDDSLEDFFREVFQQIDVRKQEQLIERAKLAHMLVINDVKDYSFMCMELLIIVIYSCYNGVCKFTNWYNQVYNLLEPDKKQPPFAYFFEQQFKQIQIQIKTVEAPFDNKRTIVLSSKNSLYGVIAYTWYSLYLKNPNVFLIINGEDTERVEQNIMDLKKFINAINTIQQ